MAEAVVVSTARSPIGRARKGSLVPLRPDGLAAQFGLGTMCVGGGQGMAIILERLS